MGLMSQKPIREENVLTTGCHSPRANIMHSFLHIDGLPWVQIYDGCKFRGRRYTLHSIWTPHLEKEELKVNISSSRGLRNALIGLLWRDHSLSRESGELRSGLEGWVEAAAF